MRKKETFIIDEHEIEIFQLPIPTSLKVMTRLSKILAKPIGSAIAGGSSDSESVLDKKMDLGNILGNIGEKLDEEIVISTIEMMLPYLTIDKKQVKNLESFDEFGISFLLRVVFKILEVNYADFFPGNLARGLDQTKKLESQ